MKNNELGLMQHNGGRGRDRRIFYSPVDYDVDEDRQVQEGATEDFEDSFQ